MYLTNLNYETCSSQPEELSANNTGRYQSRYLHVRFTHNVYIRDIIEVLLAKGLEEIALFEKSDHKIAFLVYDKVKDFQVDKNSNEITGPNYLIELLGTAVLLTLSKNKSDFDTAVTVFKDRISFDSYKPLLYTQENFFINLLIKDFDYYSRLFKIRDVENMKDKEFDYNIDQFKLSGRRLRDNINSYRDALYEFNSILIKRQLPSIPSVLDSKIEDLLENPKSQSFFSEIESKPDNQILNLSNIDLSKQRVDDTKFEEPLQYKGFMLDYEPVIMEMSKKTEYRQILKNLNITDQEKILNIFQQDIIDKPSLNYLIGFDELFLQFMVDTYCSKNNINMSKTKNNVLRLIGMYVNKKAKPKSSDPNVWIVNLRDNLPDPLLQFLKKYVKNL